MCVPSCHDAGKSFLAARLAAWWIGTHPPGEAFVLTSAPTHRQVKGVLWQEIGAAFRRARLPGRLNQTEWWIGDRLVGMGLKPSEFDPDAFQGFHRRYVLVIFDEASGIPGPLWDAADSLVANEESRFLAIGNPTDVASRFGEECKPGSGWAVEPIDGLLTPNFTGEACPEAVSRLLLSKTWVEEKRRKWGEGSPLWISKVRGQFPQTSTDGVIPSGWVERAQNKESVPGDPSVLGMDVGAGGNKNVIAHRRGGHVRIIRRDQEPDTMKSTGNLIADLKTTGALHALVDEIGVGRGVVDRGREQGQPIIGVNVGRPARDTEAYANLRAELWWGLRERFETDEVDLDAADEDLAAQLVAMKYKRTSRGQIIIESKAEMKKRGLESPDEADAVMLAFAPIGGPVDVRELIG